MPGHTKGIVLSGNSSRFFGFFAAARAEGGAGTAAIEAFDDDGWPRSARTAAEVGGSTPAPRLTRPST